MASSVVEICNSALTKVGSDRISSLDEDSLPARICNERYDPIRLALLRSHPWNFAINRVELAEVDADEDLYWDLDNVFELPSDVLRVLEIDSESTNWKVEQRYLLADSDTVIIKYIEDVEDVSKFDANFSEALAWSLAADIVQRLTQNATLTKNVMDASEKYLRTARSYDAQEGYPNRVRSSKYTNARF